MSKPVMKKLTQGDDETNLDFGMRQAKEKRGYRKALRRWREVGDTSSVTAMSTAEASEEPEGVDRITQYSGGRRKAIEEALREAEGK